MKTKQLLYVSPELYLLIATLYYWSLTSSIFNPIAISLTLIIVLQIVFRKTISGLLISGVFIILNLYLVLALISELSEFIVKTENYTNLMIVGSLFLGINIAAGSLMFWKYVKRGAIRNSSNHK